MALFNGLPISPVFEADLTPLQLQLLALQGESRGCDAGLHLIYVCEGSFTARCAGTERSLAAGQCCLIGPFDFFSSCANNCTLLLLRLETGLLKNQFPEVFRLPFKNFCSDPQYPRLHELVAQALHMAGEAAPAQPLARQSFCLNLLQQCVRSFGYAQHSPCFEGKQAQLAAELEYCAAHLAQPLSPIDAAARCYLSVPYFSKLFRRATGVSYTEYVTELRLSSACIALNQGGESVSAIAQRFGFASPRAFSAAYRTRYGHLPSRRPGAPASAGTGNYLRQLENSLGMQLPLLQLQPAPIDCLAEDAPLPKGWRSCICLGSALSLLESGRQQALRRFLHSGHFSCGILQDLLSPQLLLQSEGGTPNFILLDQVLDFVLAQGLVPALRFSGRPLPAPQQLTPWLETVGLLLNHSIARYGRSHVQTWQLAPAPLPEQSSPKDAAQYSSFFVQLYRLVKRIDPAFQLCSPTLLPHTLQDTDPWLAGFLGHCRECGCLPDAFSVAFYPIAQDGSFAPDALQSFIRRCFFTFERMGLPYETLHLECCALQADAPQQLADTLFYGTWLAKNLTESYPRLASYTLASLCDTPTAPPFCGQDSLLSSAGAAKPAGQAVALLSRMGQSLVARGDGYLLSKSEQGLQLLLYNYSHPTRSARIGSDPYARFPRLARRRFSIALSNLFAAQWRRTDFILTRSQSCVLTQWENMGAPEMLTPEDEQYLQALARPRQLHTTLEAPGGSAVVQQTLEPFEIYFICLSPL